MGEMPAFWTSFCTLCRQIAAALFLAGIISIAATALAWGEIGDQEPKLWAQLFQSGIILAVGGAVITMFFRFKDTATAKMQSDKEEQTKAINEAKAELARSQEATRRQIEQLTYAVLGIEGHGGGMMAAIATDQTRRHELVTSVMRLYERVHDLAVLTRRLCQEAGLDFDNRLLEDK